MNKKEKVMKLKSKRGLKKKKWKKKKTCFVSWKAYLFYCYFFITQFPLHFKDDL
jgi:hypothetical protein